MHAQLPAAVACMSEIAAKELLCVYTGIDAVALWRPFLYQSGFRHFSANK